MFVLQAGGDPGISGHHERIFPHSKVLYAEANLRPGAGIVRLREGPSQKHSPTAAMGGSHS